MRRIFVTGIGTGVGKTLAAAVLTEALRADYWKPVQTGPEADRDLNELRRLVSCNSTVFHKETYHFRTPASPHLAAALESSEIALSALTPPATNNPFLVIEGAGGLLVPLNNRHYVIDMAKAMQAEVVLVCRSYLGCINHSLLSIEYLLKNGFQVAGLVLNGSFDPLVRAAILDYAPLPVIAEFPECNSVDEELVKQLAGSVQLSALSFA